ncbi:MAG: transglutaminase domain-containing protein [Verrucomicrobia bacterium]|nr:transglutaminase domain-containing protein [Verrucomicrobiota bacterium]
MELAQQRKTKARHAAIKAQQRLKASFSVLLHPALAAISPALHTLRNIFIGSIWTRLAQARFAWRCAIKLTALALLTLVVLFPHPLLLVREIQHVCDVESLLQTNLPALVQINHDIDALLATNTAKLTEFKAVERFVYQRIKYQYDWDNWGNLDYWPTAAEVLERGREDCDGQAVLAATILRARGHTNARIVANLNHVWVAVGTNELMGPQADKNIRREGGKTIVTFPALKTVLDNLAFASKFPVTREIILFFGLLLACYHPCESLAGFFGLSTMGLIGFALLLHWGGQRMDREVSGVNFDFVFGLLLLVASVALAFSMNKLLSRAAPP